MEVQFGPNSIDDQNLLYKLQRKCKVFNTLDPLPHRGYSLVASASKYGIVFVGAPEGILLIYYLRDLIDKDSEQKHVSIKLQEKATHIAVSCDYELLAVTGGQTLWIYKISNFQNQNTSPVVSLRCDVNPSTFVCSLQWNPCIPNTIAIAFFDGTLLVSQVDTVQVKKIQANARCICWSPKGKQLVVGNNDGTLCQYKPDLTPMKMIPAPNLFEGSPVETLAIYWISTYQFAVVYRNALDNSRPVVTIVNTPKAGQPSCLNYEDICYSMGSNRPWYYYLQGIAQWNLILTSSANSMEIATLASVDGCNWLQFCQTDEGRPELPLTDKKQENYPVGICIDTCAIHQLPWGENESLPYMPLLHVVSQTGLLTTFNIINLKREAAQICTPPQQFILPASLMTNSVPGESPPPQPDPMPAPAQIPTPAQMPTPAQTPTPAAQLPAQPVTQPVLSAFQATTVPHISSAPSIGLAQVTNVQLPISQAFSSVPAPKSQLMESKPKVEEKSVPVAQPLIAKSTVQPPTQPSIPQTKDVAAEPKIDMETINRNKEIKLKSMLIKEVNDFQTELYKFMVQTQEMHVQHQNDINSLEADFDLQSLDPAKLKTECSLEELQSAVIQLKLELVRACAVVAEARTHSEAKDLYQWTQADPLTTKRVASVKKLAYYVQTQLEQAQRALDYKWSEIASRGPQFTKPGQRMIRPILDDVYQPLVKQQEILSRQEAVLRTMRNTLKECDATPMFKSTSLLRSTPFKNKDPLSKLTKNILNMSIESQINNDQKPLLSDQKLDALRDMLSNHKTVKIKPVNMELRKHLTAMKLNYEKSVEEKAKLYSNMQHVPVQIKHVVDDEVKSAHPSMFKTEPKSEPKMESFLQPTISSFTPVPSSELDVKPFTNAQNVVRTLFADDPRKESLTTSKVASPQNVPQPEIFHKQQTAGPATMIKSETQCVLKDLLQNKTQNNIIEKSDGNTFMGQKICTPSAFSFSAPQQTPSTMISNVFAPKPFSESKGLFGKPQAPAFTSLPKNDMPAPITMKSEEVTNTVSNKQADVKPKVEKPLTNLFAMKPSLPQVANMQNFTTPEDKKSVTKSIDKIADNLKENKPKAVIVSTIKENINDKKEVLKENEANNVNISKNILGSAPQYNTTSYVKKETEVKSENKSNTVETTKNFGVTSNASSIFATANAKNLSNGQKSHSIFGGTTSSTATSVFGTTTSANSQDVLSSSNTVTSSSASSLFANAVASQPTFESKTSPKKVDSDIITTTSTVATAAVSVFSTPIKTSAFSTPSATSTSVFGTATTKSIFGTPKKDEDPTITTSSQPSPNSAFAAPITSVSEINTPVTTSAFSTATSSVFGSTTPTNPTPVFGTQATSSTSLFTSTAPITSTSVFTNQTSVFGSPTKTSQSKIFGTPTQTTQASLFDSTQTTQSSVFGSAQKTPTSVFGTSTTSTSLFGTPTQTQASIFGSPQTTQSSVFGSSAPVTQSSIFGTPTQVGQTSVFGTPPATTSQNTSLFGGADSNLFAAASISTTKAGSPTSGGNIFGGSPSGSVFGGSNTNVFASKATFGQSNPTAASIFGSAASFGQKQNTNLWGAGNTTTVFGQQTNTQGSIFGTGSGGSFSAPSTAQPFSSPQPGPFSGGESKPSAFGSPQQQGTPAFGGSPAFGSQPVFGQSSPSFGTPAGNGFGSFSNSFNKSPSNTGFGAPAAFGGGATFGGSAFGSSPAKVFGGASPGFGNSAQSNSTFENLASQNTLTFGNLAQQSGTPPAQAPSFNTSPSFTGWRG